MKTILIADDEYALVETLREFLADEGYTVRTAGNGQQAMVDLNQHRPDLLLMDVMMPYLGGLEVLQRIRLKEGLKGLPVILMSSAPRTSIDQSVVALASAFLKKPFKLQLMLDTIRQAISK
jgi:two-component system, sensor histidine kinase ChiS